MLPNWNSLSGGHLRPYKGLKKLVGSLPNLKRKRLGSSTSKETRSRSAGGGSLLEESKGGEVGWIKMSQIGESIGQRKGVKKRMKGELRHEIFCQGRGHPKLDPCLARYMKYKIHFVEHLAMSCCFPFY